MNLVVGLRQPLERRYGAAGFEAIRRSLDNYVAAALQPSVIAFLDEPDESLLVPRASVAHTPQTLLAGIRSLRAVNPIDSLLLVGGDSLMPCWQFDNPIVDRAADPDPFVLTDNPYGSLTDTLEEYLAPDLAIGRLADPPGRSAADLVAVIDAAAANRRERLVRQGSAAFFNNEWTEPARSVMDVMLPLVDEHQAPGYVLSPANRTDLDRGFLYFNLHGFPDDPEWKAFDPVRGHFHTVIAPHVLDDAEISGTVVFAENCYGALLPAGRDSCAARMIRCGVRAFVGATGLSFGSHIRPNVLLDNADFLAHRFFTRAVAGTSPGDALAAARRDYAADSAVPLSNPFKRKTLLQYRLLGDPSMN